MKNLFFEAIYLSDDQIVPKSQRHKVPPRGDAPLALPSFLLPLKVDAATSFVVRRLDVHTDTTVTLGPRV